MEKTDDYRDRFGGLDSGELRRLEWREEMARGRSSSSYQVLLTIANSGKASILALAGLLSSTNPDDALAVGTEVWPAKPIATAEAVFTSLAPAET